jgi:hypothetical protein
LDAIRPNITVGTIEFSGPSDTKPGCTQAAGYDFSPIVKQTYPWRSSPIFLVIEFNRNGVAFHGVNIDAITKRGR